MTLPYKNDTSSKKRQVARMFDAISGKYDFLNHFLSLGIDVIWRKKAIQSLQQYQPKLILDVATGTGDFAIEALKLNPLQIIGIDISEKMLEIGRKKIKNLGYDKRIELRLADSENLPFDDNKFDVIIVSFGVRNFENLQKGLLEILRVLKPGGCVSILEFSKPTSRIIAPIYSVYFKVITPIVGKFFSKDSFAYKYLPESVESFPNGKNFTDILTQIGYKNTTCKPLTFGISSLYTGFK